MTQAAEGACVRIPILLVDDDQVFREALGENLRADGHAVEDCGSPGTALTAMRVREFSVLVTDHSMSGGTGMDLALRFHQRFAGPTVVVTAYSNAGLLALVAARDYVSLLRKPVDYDELHELVHRLLDREANSRMLENADPDRPAAGNPADGAGGERDR